MPKKMVAAAVVALALAAAGAAAASAVTHQGFRSSSSSSANRLTLHKTKLGKVIATGSGMTLYLFKADKGTKSACYGKCATFWPPMLASKKPAAGAGVKSSLIGLTKRKNGTHQVTYNRHPLYRFKLDKGAGQIKGQGQDFFGGLWWAVNSAGKAVTKSPPPSGTTTGTTNTTTTIRY
jgi:predicted lipoprotein with Yx(FWY)xxD motif